MYCFGSGGEAIRQRSGWICQALSVIVVLCCVFGFCKIGRLSRVNSTECRLPFNTLYLKKKMTVARPTASEDAKLGLHLDGAARSIKLFEYLHFWVRC